MKEIPTRVGVVLCILAGVITLVLSIVWSGREDRALDKAQLLWAQGKYDESILMLQSLIEKDMESVDAHHLLAANYGSKMDREAVGDAGKRLIALNKYMPMWLSEYEETLSLALEHKTDDATEVIRYCYFNLRQYLKYEAEPCASLIEGFAEDPNYSKQIKQLRENLQRLIDLIKRYEVSFPNVVGGYTEDEELMEKYKLQAIEQIQEAFENE